MRFRTVLLTVAASSSALLAVGPTLASAATAPFTDPAQHGALTFCDRNNQPIRSGSLYTRPFAWKAVSSAPAPTGYSAKGSLANLAAYQPIQYEDPADWSGSQLTVSAQYSNPAHPAAQATNLDASLYGFVNAYPPHWDHLVVIRMLFDSPQMGTENSTYPAAVLRIQGNRWTQLNPGSASCSSGAAVSRELSLLPKRLLRREHADLPVGAKAPASSRAAPGTATSRAGGDSSSTAGGAAKGSGSGDGDRGSGAQAADSEGLGVGPVVGIGLGALLVVGLGVWTALLFRRSHNATGLPESPR